MRSAETDRIREKLRRLLVNVCKSPEDDGPRLVYAAAIESAGRLGDPIRAEFIRIQCELAQPNLADDRWMELTDRREELEALHRDRWLGELPHLPGVIWLPGFDRGFAEHIACKGTDAFWRHAPTIFVTAPIRSLSLSPPIEIRRIVAIPEIARLNRLIFQYCQLKPEDGRTLAMSPNIAGLAALHLAGNRLGDTGVSALAASPYLRHLDNLDVGDNKVGDEGVTALARSPIVGTLTHLGLARSRLTDNGALALSNSKYLENLTGLTLWACKLIGAKGKAALKARFGDRVSFVD
jgi:uncharacterized protein (TIGR02996 family)